MITAETCTSSSYRRLDWGRSALAWVLRYEWPSLSTCTASLSQVPSVPEDYRGAKTWHLRQVRIATSEPQWAVDHQPEATTSRHVLSKTPPEHTTPNTPQSLLRPGWRESHTAALTVRDWPLVQFLPPLTFALPSACPLACPRHHRSCHPRHSETAL
jgi:hypothetical protein